MASGIKVSTGLKRPRYFDRQQLRAEDLNLEQDYLSRRHRRMARFLHGWGLVCGGLVQRAPERGPWFLRVGETYAISPLGDAIYIPPNLAPLDFEDCIRTACGETPVECEDLPIGSVTPRPGAGTPRPGIGTPAPGTGLDSVYLIARPCVVPAGTEAKFPDDCGHPGNQMEVNRVCETLELDVVCELPPSHRMPTNCESIRRLICQPVDVPGTTPPPYRSDGTTWTPGYATGYPILMPPADIPDQDNFVVLALMDVRGRGIQNLSHAVRRRLFPVELLQRYLECECQPPATPTPTPTPTQTPTPTPTPTPTLTPIPPPYTIIITTAPPVLVTTLPPVPVTTLPPIFTDEPPIFVTEIPPIGITERPLEPFTQPAPFDDVLINELDLRAFDVERGRRTSIDELVLLGDDEKSALREAGITNLAELYAADTQLLVETLGISDVRAAEYKNSAVESFRRTDTITLDGNAFDIARGASMPVEEVMNIGNVRGNALRRQGLESVVDVANADAAALSTRLGVTEETAREMIADAQSRIRRG